jgi:hypothetical protein
MIYNSGGGFGSGCVSFIIVEKVLRRGAKRARITLEIHYLVNL